MSIIELMSLRHSMNVIRRFLPRMIIQITFENQIFQKARTKEQTRHYCDRTTDIG